ncbi:MAG: exodeoxyribonuclease VII small subunit [Candidatus Dormibacteraeota bacterium]|nr:exodeoxyribonuclease VII small subunit [Candidatus Dormibacteraeota bacterium]
MNAVPGDEVATLTYEAALAQLDALIGRLEAGSIALEDAIAAYERGVRLARHCEDLLERTERRVTALMIGADGSLSEAPLETPAGVAASAAPPPPARPRARPVDPDEIPF